MSLGDATATWTTSSLLVPTFIHLSVYLLIH